MMSDDEGTAQKKKEKASEREADPKPQIVWRWKGKAGAVSSVPNRDLYDYEVKAWVGTRARATGLLNTELWEPVEGWDLKDLPNPDLPKTG